VKSPQKHLKKEGLMGSEGLDFCFVVYEYENGLFAVKQCLANALES
jgi:hypothetical protein